MLLYLLGILLVVLAGMGTGTTAWPFKITKDISMELYLFIYISVGLVLLPWAVVFIFLDPVALIHQVGMRPLLLATICSSCWGVANILYYVCVLKIGAALTGAFLSSFGMSVGILMPFVFKGSGIFQDSPNLNSQAGLLVLAALAVMILGVVLTTIAGCGRDRQIQTLGIDRKKEQAMGGFVQGFFLVILAGILSAGISLAFVYCQNDLIVAAKKQGAGELVATITAWAFAVFGGAMINLIYCLTMMIRKGTWRLVRVRKDEVLFGIIVGFQYLAALVCLGQGMILLGVIGASIGFGIQQSMQLLGNQMVGFLGGEWRGIGGRPRRIMYASLIVIVVAFILLSVSKAWV